jgi:hypothetical protein
MPRSLLWRFHRGPVRWMRRKNPELLANHAWLELLVRFYRPRAEILNGSWTFPQAEPT